MPEIGNYYFKIENRNLFKVISDYDIEMIVNNPEDYIHINKDFNPETDIICMNIYSPKEYSIIKDFYTEYDDERIEQPINFIKNK